MMKDVLLARALAGGSSGGGKLPIGETTTVKEVLAECQAEFNAELGQFGILTKFHLEAGQKYTVTVNGIEYQSTAFNLSDIGESIEGVSVLLVNDEFVSGGNMYFSVFVYNEEVFENFGYGGYVQLSDGSTTLTISIRQEVTTVQKMSGKYVEGMGYEEDGVVHPIDQKFLPSGGGETLYVTLSQGTDGSPITDVPYDEVVTAGEKGMPVKLIQRYEDGNGHMAYTMMEAHKVSSSGSHFFGFLRDSNNMMLVGVVWTPGGFSPFQYQFT